MGSSCLSNSLIFDEIRKIWVNATPEEQVRQKLLQKMIRELRFPKELLTVEKELGELPHLTGERGAPQRRIDILCFGRDIHSDYPLYPLLLIECKQLKIDAAAEEQLLGYNCFVKAPFFALAGADEIKFGYHDSAQEKPIFLNFLPPYAQLLATLQK